MARKKQKIEVIVNMPDEATVGELVAKAMADIVIARINNLPEEKRLPTLNVILELEKKQTG